MEILDGVCAVIGGAVVGACIGAVFVGAAYKFFKWVTT